MWIEPPHVWPPRTVSERGLAGPVLSQFLSQSPPFGTVHQRPPQVLPRSRTSAAHAEQRPAVLEGVLGATRIAFRQAQAGHRRGGRPMSLAPTGERCRPRRFGGTGARG